MASKVEIIFTGVPLVNQRIEIREGLFATIINEVFKTQRMSSYQVKLPQDTGGGIYNSFISTNYKNAFNADYNTGGLFIVTWTQDAVGSGTGSVTIEATYPNAAFEVLINTAPATINIFNESTTDFSIDSQTFEEADTLPCQYAKVVVDTSDLAVNILEPFVLMGNTANPIEFDWLRGQSFNLKLQDDDGFYINQPITTPDYLNSANFSITINNSPFGATVIVQNTASNGLDLEYSLDNATWQPSNTFAGLLPDNYILYVRDQLGCSFSQPFVITDNTIYTPVRYVSNSNAIIYAERVTFGDAINYKNDGNTLSCEVDDEPRFQEIQLFQTADIVPTQFRSNYETVVATVIKPDGTTVNIPIVKKSNNIGIKDKRLALSYNLGGGKTGIYFESGNIYDYVTGAVIDSYALNGSLPYWGTAGNYLSVGPYFYLIEDVIFDEVKNAFVLVVSSFYTGVDTPIVVGCIFNYQDYEVYEYYIDMLPFLGMDIRVKLEMTDPNFPAATWLSEVIRVAVRHKNTVEVRYKNTTNTDIYYASGIDFKIRLSLFDKVGYLRDESEITDTDTNIILLNGDLREGDEYVFELMTKHLYQKVGRALSHEIVFIDEVGYVKDGSPTLEKQDQSNAYLLTQKMLKTGNSYTSQSFGVSNAQNQGVPVNIPGLLDHNNGFVQY